MSVTIGMKGSAEALVCESNTAQAAGSGQNLMKLTLR